MGILGWGREALDNAASWTVEAAANVVGWIGDRLADAGAILTGLWGPILAGIAAVAVLRIVRWFLLLWRGRRPRVQITSFAWATSDNADREATWVTSLFREQLAALRLDALDPLPDRAPGAPLVEIVEGVGQGVGRSLDIGKALGKLFRAVWPDSAYEVWGTLRPNEGGGGRISVQLIERRRGNRTLLNIALDEASWKDGAREAALAVAGALYPRVRRTDRGPWTMWNRAVPRQLMGNYHTARRYEQENRFEDALHTYHAALEEDPLNPNLRLKIAMLQERLELYLDAWVTYEAIVDESDRRAWRGPDRRVYLLALYRLAVMLSTGCVAERWVKNTERNEEWTKRDEERNKRRAQILLSLRSDRLFEKRRLQAGAEGLAKHSPRLISKRIRRASPSYLLLLLLSLEAGMEEPDDLLGLFERPATAGKERIDAVLLVLSLKRLEELDLALRAVGPWRPRLRREWRKRRQAQTRKLRRAEFSRSVIRVSKLLVRNRIAANLEGQVLARAEGAFEDRERWIEEIRQAHRKLTKRWPFSPTSTRQRIVHWLAPRRRLTNRRDDAWQLHYNAACVTASALRKDSVVTHWLDELRKPRPNEAERWVARRRRKRTERRRRALVTATGSPDAIEKGLAQRAIEELEEYAFRAGSRRVATQADWLAIDDPDLRALNDKQEFELWASHHLPLELSEKESSRKADVKRFMVRVLHEGACVFADLWWERARQADPPTAQLMDWWTREREVWEALALSCREHLSWQQRLVWLQAVQKRLHATRMDGKVDFSHEARGTAAADSMPQALFKLVAELAGDGVAGAGSNGSSPPPAKVLDWVAERTARVQSAFEAGEHDTRANGALHGEAERREALRAARVWTRLAEALDVELRTPRKENEDQELRKNLDAVREELPVGANP